MIAEIYSGDIGFYVVDYQSYSSTQWTAQRYPTVKKYFNFNSGKSGYIIIHEI